MRYPFYSHSQLSGQILVFNRLSRHRLSVRLYVLSNQDANPALPIGSSWSRQPDFGAASACICDGSLLAIGNRAGSILLLK